MKKIWLMAVATYKQRVRSGSFLILTFILPAMMIVAGAIPVIISLRGEEITRVGYIDETSQLAAVDQVDVDGSILNFQRFVDVDAAQSAWQQGEIDGYLVFPEGYLQGESPAFYGASEPSQSVELGMRNFVRQALLPQSPSWLVERLEDPSKQVFIAQNTGEQVSEGIGLIVRAAMPAAFSIVLGLSLLLTSSQMGAVIVREKDQRSMEIVITSIGPRQLVTGKVLGMTLLVLTQFAIWGIGAAIGIGLALAGEFTLQEINLPWEVFLWAFLLGVPGYFLYAVLAAGLGIIAGDTRQAQQLSGFLGFIGLIPLWFAGVLIQSPNSPLAVGLTLFPLTGPIFALLRMSFVEIPLWQLGLSLVFLLVSLVLGIWLVSRIFRIAMLMYGQSFNLKQVVSSLKEV
jgi:ABC-2 type transport system permease protein